MASRISMTLPNPFILPGEVARASEGTRARRMVDTVSNVKLENAADDTLITLFLQGEEQAYRHLVERYQERIRNLIYSIFKDRELVEDLSQEVFLKAYEALPHFRFESSFYTWIYRIAVNKSRDELRRRKIRRFLSFQALDNGVRAELDMRMSTPPQTNEYADIVSLGLKALPDHQRIVVVLKDIEGLSYEEIADVLQIEVGTVKSRLSRARGMLREVLGPLLKEARP